MDGDEPSLQVLQTFYSYFRTGACMILEITNCSRSRDLNSVINKTDERTAVFGWKGYKKSVVASDGAFAETRKTANTL